MLAWFSITAVIRAGVALLLGAIAWMIVTWVQNPFREDWLSTPVQIEASHVPSGLVEVGSLGTVRIRIRAAQDAWTHVQSSDFKASVDLTKAAAGIHSVDVKIDTSGDYQLVDWQPRRVTVRLEPLVTRDIPVSLQLTGQLPDGYVLSGQSLTPSTVQISGEQDLAQTVTQASVVLDLSGVRGDVTQSVAPQLTDDKGQVVNNLQFTPATVRASLQVDRQIGVKTIPVRVTTTGQVASGYWLSSLTVSPETMTITGGPAALSQVDYLDLPPLDLSGAKTDVTRTSTINSGNGYSLVGAGEVTVTANVEPLRTTEVLPLGIAVQGVASGLEARIAPATVEVTIGGLVPTLSALKPGDISAVVDVSSLGAGPHTVPVHINAPASVSLDSARPPNATVTLAAPAPTPTASPPPAAAPSASPSASAAPAPTASASPAGSAAASPSSSASSVSVPAR